MPLNKKALIVFVRYPEAGRVKSRLSAGIGNEKAAQLYERLVRRTLGLVTEYKRIRPRVDLFVFFTPASYEDRFKAGFPGPWKLVPQEGIHLGARMDHAVQDVLRRGYTNVLLVGTDLLDLDHEDFDDGFHALEQGSAALGPAADGGFYLIGLTQPCPQAFQPEVWGTNEAFQRTQRLLLEAGFRVQVLKERRDIDRPEDLRLLSGSPYFEGSLSIVIPSLKASERLEPMISALEAGLWPGDEVVIVQGMANPPPSIVTMSTRTRLLYAPKGRGLQLNRGAQAAGGSMLWFLHDDSRAPSHSGYLIRKALASPQVSLGCFQLGFSPSPPPLTLIAQWANLRTRLFKLPYGDQGLFCRRALFDCIGGFQRAYLMEDVDLVQRLRRRGTVAMVPETLYTSAQRYLGRGIFRASLQNHWLMLLYLCGVDDRKLYSLYYAAR